MTRFEEIQRDKSKLISILTSWADDDSYDYEYFDEWLNCDWNEDDIKRYYDCLKERNRKLIREVNYYKSKAEILENRVNELLGKEVS